jgi:hypothetical protein
MFTTNFKLQRRNLVLHMTDLQIVFHIFFVQHNNGKEMFGVEGKCLRRENDRIHCHQIYVKHVKTNEHKYCFDYYLQSNI